MTNQDLSYYDLLQVSPHACKEVIEAAYRALQKQMHPDQGGDTELAQVINRAKEVLTDPIERNRYDTRMRIGTAETYRSQGKVVERTYIFCLACGARNCVTRDRPEFGQCEQCGSPYIRQNARESGGQGYAQSSQGAASSSTHGHQRDATSKVTLGSLVFYAAAILLILSPLLSLCSSGS